MNDPNGLVKVGGIYHLFFQYYPNGTVWGPMHWGHATSTDLIHWKELPIALYPDSLGYIFSGSAVVDSNNTTGFGRNGKIPVVAMFTHHDPKGEKAGSKTFQNQSLAFSLDGGMNWAKYSGNPVLKNPGIVDFRDPSVSWHAAEKKWVLTLATKDRITFYSSPNLKQWTKESEFGEKLGAHGGVWECPNLFFLDGHWVLLISNNPGGPNGGSGTQYFIGDWDGHQFTAKDTATRWIDYGPDDYAGVTFNHTGNRKIFLGWMSNWDYANKVPTSPWRNAMTIPRELRLVHADGTAARASAAATGTGPGSPAGAESRLWLASRPITSLRLLSAKNQSNHQLTDTVGLYRIDDDGIPVHSFTYTFSNGKDFVIVGYDQPTNRYYIDRSRSGNVGFHKGFGSTYYAPRISTAQKISLTIVMDAASVEVFADGGLTVMTAVFFAERPLGRINTDSNGNQQVTDLVTALP